MTHLGVCGSHEQAVQDASHVIVAVVIQPFVDVEYVLIVGRLPGLVEHAQHLVKPVIYLTVQTRYLYDNTVVSQTLYKCIRQSLGDRMSVIIK